MNKVFIYAAIMLFAGLVAFHVHTKVLTREGMANANAPPPPSASKTPLPSNLPNSQTKSQPKTSACGDDCSTYDEINKTLQDFEKLNKRYETSNESVQKVDKDIIKLSNNVKNMGNRKTPGGRPPMDKKMVS
jgi:peptidoglycan hydrolase CwlO-like protein